jgi:hypothetical protein
MSERWLGEQLSMHLAPVTAPAEIWNRRARPQRRALYAVAATVALTVCAGAFFYGQGATARRQDPSVVERFRAAQPLVCSNCHI